MSFKVGMVQKQLKSRILKVLEKLEIMSGELNDTAPKQGGRASLTPKYFPSIGSKKSKTPFFATPNSA
jgi:hypothetical protein